MKSKALIIGAQTGGLTGVRTDVGTMCDLMAHRGFEVTRCEDDDATCAGILDHYEKLITDIGPGDRALVYFSGHGAYLRSAQPREQPDIQAIVPFDYSASTPSDVRAITGMQLSVLQARLTERTRNCTVILDCCHAAHLSRNPDLMVKAQTRPTYVDFREHDNRLRENGFPVNLAPPVSNPDSVRVVACAPFQSAFEYTTHDDVRMGLATESLAIALREAGSTPVTWSALMRRVRQRVLLLSPGQRPEVEGPSGRLLFDTTTVETADAWPVVQSSSSRVSIPGAGLIKAAIGDEFAIMPQGAAAVAESAMIAVATVDRVTSLAAEARLVFRDGHTEIPMGAAAFPLKISARRWPVLVPGGNAMSAAVRSAIEANTQLRPVESRDEAVDGVLAEVTVADMLGLHDAVGPLVQPASADAKGINRTVASLSRMAKAANLRALEPTSVEELPDRVSLEWGKVVDGAGQPLPNSGGSLRAGENIYLKLGNHSDRNLFFHLFDIGVDDAITLIMTESPSGERIEPGGEHVVSERDGTLEGLTLSWPAATPTLAPRPETVLLLVSAVPEDLSAFGQGGARAESVIRALSESGSPLQELLAYLDLGGSRNLPRERARSTARYQVARIDFDLSPS